MHRQPDTPFDVRFRELEAEPVAYVVGKYFGFSNNDSPNYLALYGADSKLIQNYWIAFKGLRRISLVVCES
jgi:hypothetical protein